MPNFSIPSDGSSVAVADFPKAAEATLDKLEDAVKKDAKAAIDAAIALVKGGHGGKEHVVAYISSGEGVGTSVGVFHKPAPVVLPPPAEPPVAPPVYSPFSTHAKPEEIAREAAATGKPVEQVAKELGAATVTVTKTDDKGVTTTVTKPTGVKPAPVIPPDKANLPTQKSIATARSTGARPKAFATAKAAALAKAAAANAGAPQTNPQSDKPAPNAAEKQVAKDRAGS